MKLVWCPDTASKAYIDAVRSLSGLEDANVAELIAAMAGGWRAQLAVQAGDSLATGLALASALKHTRGRRVVIRPSSAGAAAAETDAAAAAAAGGGTEVVGGEVEEAMREVDGVDFLVVDMRRRDAVRVVREARAGPRGMVVVCKNVERKKGWSGMVVGKGMRVVRSAYLPIERGVEILHVGVGKGPRLGAGGSGSGSGCSRWFKHVDRVTGEEHLFRK